MRLTLPRVERVLYKGEGLMYTRGVCHSFFDFVINKCFVSIIRKHTFATLAISGHPTSL